VLVNDDMHEDLQHLRPHEAERLMGMSGQDTAGNGAAAKERLKCIGNGWDMNTVNMFFSYSAMAMHTPLQSIAPDCTSSNNNALSCVLQTASAIPEMEELTSDELLTQATLVTLSGESPDELAKAISQAQPEEQTLYLALLKHYYVNRVKENEGTVLDSGSSKHLSPAVFAPDLEDRKSLSGYDNSQ
jgi:hypothetical protein